VRAQSYPFYLLFKPPCAHLKMEHFLLFRPPFHNFSHLSSIFYTFFYLFSFKVHIGVLPCRGSFFFPPANFFLSALNLLWSIDSLSSPLLTPFPMITSPEAPEKGSEFLLFFFNSGHSFPVSVTFSVMRQPILFFPPLEPPQARSARGSKNQGPHRRNLPGRVRRSSRVPYGDSL